jgi:hypothetical protein
MKRPPLVRHPPHKSVSMTVLFPQALSGVLLVEWIGMVRIAGLNTNAMSLTYLVYYRYYGSDRRIVVRIEPPFFC